MARSFSHDILREGSRVITQSRGSLSGGRRQARTRWGWLIRAGAAAARLGGSEMGGSGVSQGLGSCQGDFWRLPYLMGCGSVEMGHDSPLAVAVPVLVPVAPEGSREGVTPLGRGTWRPSPLVVLPWGGHILLRGPFPPQPPLSHRASPASASLQGSHPAPILLPLSPGCSHPSANPALLSALLTNPALPPGSASSQSCATTHVPSQSRAASPHLGLCEPPAAAAPGGQCKSFGG